MLWLLFRYSNIENNAAAAASVIISCLFWLT